MTRFLRTVPEFTEACGDSVVCVLALMTLKKKKRKEKERDRAVCVAAAPPHVPERGNKTLGRWKVYKASNAVTKVNKQPQQASLPLSLSLSLSLSDRKSVV